MSVLPIEIWRMIIEFAYDPLKLGWHRDLQKISLTSKIHCDLIQYLFELYIKNPVFPTGRFSGYLIKKDIIKYLIRDVAPIDPGFLSRTKNIDPRFLSRTKKLALNKKEKKSYKNALYFSDKNYYHGTNFYEKTYINSRYLIAKSYTQIEKNLHETRISEIQVEIPILIIPYTNPNTNIVDQIFLIGNQSYDMKCYQRRTSHFWTENSLMLTMFDGSDLILKILTYIMKEKNPIADTISGIISQAYGRKEME